MELLLLTEDPHPGSVLPALGLLSHAVRAAAPQAMPLLGGGRRDAVLVDARTDLVAARRLCRLLHSSGMAVPVVAVLTEHGLVAMSGEWTVDAILLAGAGAAEVDARLRLLRARSAADSSRGNALVLGELVIDETMYSVRRRGRQLELTYMEFELLNYLAQHAGRVFTRSQLLQQVWCYDFVSNVRTVDVHLRRLRAKLGSEHEHMIATVGSVGYKLVRPGRGVPGMAAACRDVDDEREDQGDQATHLGIGMA